MNLGYFPVSYCTISSTLQTGFASCSVPELQPVACVPDVMETWKAMRFSKQKRKLVKGSTAELGCVRASQLRVVITSYGP